MLALSIGGDCVELPLGIFKVHAGTYATADSMPNIRSPWPEWSAAVLALLAAALMRG